MSLIVGLSWFGVMVMFLIRFETQASKIRQMQIAHNKMQALLCYMIMEHPELYPDIVMKDEKELDEK
jgi:hypothetical protein